jgi:hypothetical protein
VAAPAEEVSTQDPWRDRFSAMTGLGQWLVGGANAAVQYKTGRLALEYSHGQGLHMNNATFLLSPEEQAGEVDKRIPWTTGFGVGIGLLPNLHLLIEFKAHRIEMRGADKNEAIAFTSYTIGPGLFYDLYLWRSLFLQTSLRWWPTVASTLDPSARLHGPDGSALKVAREAVGPTGVFGNVSLGWTF